MNLLPYCLYYQQVGFKAFLNITPTISHSPAPASVPPGTPASSYFTLTLDENPLAEFVELPDEALEGGLWFSNVLCGVLRGALEMVRACFNHLYPLIYDTDLSYRFRCRLKPNFYLMY